MSEFKAPAIHGVDKAVADKLTIDHFYADVDTKQFIDDWSSSILSEAKRDGTNREFVAKPFIRSFEYALESLQELRGTVKGRIDELERATAEAEVNQKKQLENLSKTFEQVQLSTSGLEQKIGLVGNTAIRVGQQLESIDNQRSRFIHARDLFRYFLEFHHQGQCNQLEDMRSVQGPDGQYKAAIIARKLSNISKEVDFPGMDKTRDHIEKYNENLEKDLLETFDQAYTNGDIQTMASCSKTLLDFNGGNSCMQAYINQHEFFMSQRKMRESSFEPDKNSCDESMNGLSDPSQPPPSPDPWLIKLLGEVRGVVAKEWDIISKVFPNALFVIRQFLERIFGQSVDQYLEGLLDKAERESPLAYLRTLASAHSCLADLVEDLKQFDRQVIYPFLRRTSSAQSKQGKRDSNPASDGYKMAMPFLNLTERGYTEVSSTAERWLEETFSHFGYFDRELNFLSSTFPALTEPYFLARAKSMEHRVQAKPSMFTRLAMATNEIIASGGTSPLITQTTPVGLSSPLLHPTSPSLSRSQNDTSNLEMMPSGLDEPNTLLAITVNILCTHGEAVGRCAELSPTSDLHHLAARLFATLVDFISSRFLDRAMNRMQSQAKHRDARYHDFEDTSRTFKLVDEVGQIMQLLQHHFEFAILPLVSSSPPSYREVVVKKNTLLTNLELEINDLLELESQAILEWVRIQLNGQNRNEFRIPDDTDDMELLSMPTECCTRCVEGLRKVFQTASTHLPGPNLNIYLVDLCTGLLSLLLDHFKKLTVTPSGGLLLFRDISLYQGLILGLQIDSLITRYEILKKLADLLCMTNPTSIASLLNEGMLASLDTAAIYPYLRCREDFYTANLAELLGLGPDPAEVGTKGWAEDHAYQYSTATAAIGSTSNSNQSMLGISGLSLATPPPEPSTPGSNPPTMHWRQ